MPSTQQQFLGFLMSCIFLATGCATKDQIAQALKDNPEILAEAIKKNPGVFMASLREAAEAEQRQAMEQNSKARDSQMENDFKNPRSVKVDESRIVYGPMKAPITIVKFADFQCPACRAGYLSLEEVKKKYPGKIRFIHKNIPLEQIHPLARQAAEIYEYLVITDKPKALEFYKKAYEQQRSWRSDTDLWKLAAKIGADKKKVQAAVKKGEIEKRIQEDQKEHTALGFEGTPAYMINGIAMYGAPAPEDMAAVIDRILAKK